MKEWRIYCTASWHFFSETSRAPSNWSMPWVGQTSFLQMELWASYENLFSVNALSRANLISTIKINEIARVNVVSMPWVGQTSFLRPQETDRKSPFAIVSMPWVGQTSFLRRLWRCRQSCCADCVNALSRANLISTFRQFGSPPV